MNKEKILNLLGLATRARMVTLGEDLVIKTLAKKTQDEAKAEIEELKKETRKELVEDFVNRKISINQITSNSK